MIKFQRLRENEWGAWEFDEYLDYIESVSHLMPEHLGQFAGSYSSYELTSSNTLHDSRMVTLSLSKEVGDDGVTSVARMDVVLLHQSHEKHVLLSYSGIIGYSAFETEILDRVRGVDVLLHEFSLLEGRGYRHAVLFENGGGYVVDFLHFEVKYRELQAG
ncbi:hypothetical protein [Stenotrophomonas oahuensis]|uniref:Uncharacterized protein n=1 Tax=Stenotrophomonas oahuensis TaxID=3003271 RepID=A0ABY9YRL4_9GAMM|nr:hypothetical protein [Stenotrophomonas sp. A5586]WNH53221.1 hypothetical protein PDM29_02795 [Stenotrophomonas sp. A5586]